ncbi:MAG: TlpA disulfide reductase family protein [Bacteroidota bacterium]
MKNAFFLCYALSFLLGACQNKTTSLVEAQDAVPLAAIAQNLYRSTDTLSYLFTTIGEIPIYPSFEAIAPILERANDTTYIINFWATWCKPCVEELPYFEQLQAAHTEKAIQVILVSLDFKMQLERKLKPFVESRGLLSQVVVLADSDYNSWINQVDPEWSGGIPATLIYNKNARVFISESFSTYEELLTALQSSLE